MTITEFLNTPLSRLERLTGIDKGNLSKYFSGTLLSERTINKMAKALKMRPEQVLMAVIERRKSSTCVNPQAELSSV